ncbi:hypothetical protein BT63DRAFT_202341 [Microthyrium microscopicum]|uniref:E3 ubiquitin-protein ligase listerin n=1 Tax=Microthyrium microscopicum TaxID=703497 RepID=A0A6A6UH97_9PEZI|nr:hypothetical protein BT63DRAFT_202341 [Microthyrium microscopicum]
MVFPKTNAKSSHAAAAGSSFGGFGGAFTAASSPLSYLAIVPDISRIQDPNIVVIFKNLIKKDSITKARALDELHKLLTAEKPPNIDEAFLDVWLGLFPRTSIEADRKVRLLAHTVQGQIAAAVGTKLAKHMKSLIGVWLLGLYDNDKQVASTAKSALSLVFTTPDKRQQLRKVYQDSILDLCLTIIQTETPQTLSDEKTTSSEESEAKYARVLAAVLGLLPDVFRAGDASLRSKCISKYEELLGDKQLWALASADDASVRRGAHRLLRSTLDYLDLKPMLDTKSLSSAYLEKSLASNQTGSASDFLDTITAITSVYPTIWTDDWKGKKSPSSRLRSFLRSGTQGSQATYWSKITALLQAIPSLAFPTSVEDVEALLEAYRKGITKKDEPKSYLLPGVNGLLQAIPIIASQLSHEDHTLVFARYVLPLAQSYLLPSPESQWSLPATRSTETVEKMLQIPGMANILAGEWTQITEQVLEMMKLSLPEQSKDYKTSQDRISELGQRWTNISGFLSKSADDKALIQACVKKYFSTTLDLVKTRQGKPYGVAVAMVHVLQLETLKDSTEISDLLDHFLLNVMPEIFLSPSISSFGQLLTLSKGNDVFEESWKSCLKTTFAASDPAKQLNGFTELMKTARGSSLQDKLLSLPEVHKFIQSQLQHSLQSDANWDFLAAITAQIQAEDLQMDILGTMTSSLSISNESTNHALHGFEILGQRDPATLKSFADTTAGQAMMSSVLRLTEDHDETISESASKVNLIIHGLSASLPSQLAGTKTHTLTEVIKDGVVEASTKSVSVHTLAAQATAMISAKDPATIQSLLPDLAIWEKELQKFLAAPPALALRITHSSAGVLLVEPSTSVTLQETDIPRDVEGLSIPLRIAMYITEIIKTAEDLANIPSELASRLLQLLTATRMLANDKLGFLGCNNIWSSQNASLEEDIIDFVSNSQLLISGCIAQSGEGWSDDEPSSKYSFVGDAANQLFQKAQGLSSSSYYSAIAYAHLTAELIEVHGLSQTKSAALPTDLTNLRKSKQVLQTTAFINTHSSFISSVPIASRWYNECVADLTGFDFAEKPEIGIQRLCLLDLFLSSEDEAFISTAAHQRLVFLFRDLVSSLESTLELSKVQTLILSIIRRLISQLYTVYGEYWESIVEHLTSLWLKTKDIGDKDIHDPTLNVLYESIRLYQTLKQVATIEDCNDDLIEILAARESDCHKGLFNLLILDRSAPDETNQPLRIVNNAIARQASKISPSLIPEAENMYHLMNSPSESIQQAVFELLHSQIPTKQEQASLDAAIEQQVIRLPEELLSLLIMVPKVSDLEGLNLTVQNIPLNVKGHLLNWILVFDHFKNASHQLRLMYADSLKEGDYLVPLLEFAFEVLGHTKGSPPNIKFDITTLPFSPDSPRQELQWYLCHLYYLSLTHVSSIAKDWWVDCRSRLTKATVESWTAKSISPSVIAASLVDVRTWSAAQETNPIDDDAKPLTIRINASAAEVTASYELNADEEDSRSCSILVSLPPSFPLAQAAVSSLSHKTTFEERRWRSWLRITQGVIAFSNNSIVDGLLAWRRNVAGAMAGKSECTICYSVVSEDGKLPSKRCKTCKNSFHMLCLSKWFANSGERKCPLCRQEFTGLGRGTRGDRD